MTRPQDRPLAPRPLPLHLMMAGATWMSSRAALPLLKNGSLPLSETLGREDPAKTSRQSQQRARDLAKLQESLASAPDETLYSALDQEIQSRARALIDGIDAYRRHPYRRAVPEPPLLWQAGTTRLLDYGALAERPDAPPLLVVPSLINRAYILDLTQDLSLLRWLAAAGYRPLLVDWGAPGKAERDFTLTDYIAGRLEDALDAVLESTGTRPVAMGYCMGGLLALGLAVRRQTDLAGLVLMATPWNFHGDSPAQGKMLAGLLAPLAPLLELAGELPVDVIQALFACLDPMMVPRKFQAFARLDPDSPKACAFVALEDWLNDGVPLSLPVARECLAGWYGNNSTQQGEWRLAGRPVDPADLSLPCLCLIPSQDRIVPPASASALGQALPDCDSLTLPVGHIGMVVSGNAKSKVWEPLLTWLKSRPAPSA